MNRHRYSPKHEICDPQDWISEKGLESTMAFTFSPPPSTAPFMEQFNSVCTIFDELEHCELSVYPEISSLGRLHFHGYIFIWDRDDVIPFYLTDLPFLMKYATICIKVITSNDDWLEYISKQKFLMIDYCKKCGLRYHIEGPAPYHYLSLTKNEKKDIKQIPKIYKSLKEEFGDLDEGIEGISGVDY